MSVMERLDVFEAKIVSGLHTLLRLLYRFCFRSMFSITASIIKSVSERSEGFVV